MYVPLFTRAAIVAAFPPKPLLSTRFQIANWSDVQAIRIGNWKGVRSGLNGPLELYNLALDLSEKVNVAAANPEMVAKMMALLSASRTESELWPAKDAPAPKKK